MPSNSRTIARRGDPHFAREQVMRCNGKFSAAQEKTLHDPSGIEIVPAAKRGEFRLSCKQFVPRPRTEVFEFFADAFRLEDLTPPWLNFTILTPRPIEMAAGRLIDYQLRLHGIPLRWQSRIEVWQPPARFVDVQTRGPYRRWHHEHLFEETEEGTVCQDIVHYSVPGGWLVEKLLVRPDLLKIFAFRQARLRELLASPLP